MTQEVLDELGNHLALNVFSSHKIPVRFKKAMLKDDRVEFSFYYGGAREDKYLGCDGFSLSLEEVQDLLPVELVEGEVASVRYEADKPEMMSFPRPYRIPTEEDKQKIHRMSIGGSFVGPPYLWTDCNLAGKPGINLIIKCYGRDSKTVIKNNMYTDEPGIVDCPYCVSNRQP